MPVELGLWRVDDQPQRLAVQSMPLESKLERLILADPEILETKLLLLGSQVATRFGKFIDVLGIDADGVVHILELKRDRTPRDVVAQVLDYASWILELGNDEIRAIFDANHPGESFDEVFAVRFDGAPLPDELNSDHVMTIVASDLDAGTERIVAYLNNRHNLPINVMLFRYFVDDGHEYLARTWLINEDVAASASSTSKGKSTRAPWNGRDWYVSFGEGEVRSWTDAVKYGFISAGGGDWYSRTLRALPVGARIFVHAPQHGYVGVGVVEGDAVDAESAQLEVDGQTRSFRSLELRAPYRHSVREDGSDHLEYIAPVRWLATVPVDQAFWRAGLFANQNSACKLKNQFTIDQVGQKFAVTDDD